MSEFQLPETEDKTKLFSVKQTAFALAVSFSILAYYFYDQDWSTLFKATQDANLPLAFSSLFFLLVGQWVLEVYARGKHFTWFYGSFPWKDYFWMRGALYLIFIINVPLSGGARVLYLVKKTGMSWTLYFGIGIFRLILMSGLIALIMLLATYPMLSGNLFEQSGVPMIYWFVFIIWNLFVFFDFYFAFFHQRFLGLSYLIRNKIDHEFFTPFKQASRYQWIWTMFFSFLPVFLLIVCYWVTASAFGIEIPFWYFSLSMIFVIILSNLPLTFGGFGTTTMAWVLFYSDYADETTLLSFTLFLPIARIVVFSIIGLFCLKPALKDLFELLVEAQSSKGDLQKQQAKQDIKSIFFK